ncbi:TY5A, partial [Symbiodinium sp. KB8]
MGAQSAKAKPPTMLNGTFGSYGSVGPMMMDSEVRGPPPVSESQREGASGNAGRADQGHGVASLRAAAGRVMATVAAKVQGAMPPSGKAGSASAFLGQDDGGSAGTLGSGYVTAGSDNPRDYPSSSGVQEAVEPGLFSPQQARRLREMQSEASVRVELFPTMSGTHLTEDVEEVDDEADANKSVRQVEARQQGAIAKRDDGASTARAAKAEAHAKAKSADPGLKKVLSEAAGVLRDVLSTQSANAEGNTPVSAEQTRSQAGASSADHSVLGGESPIAAAAKIQAQLENLESRLSDQGPRMRAVHVSQEVQEEPTALLDSGATHAVLDASSVNGADLIPCTVSLAGDQRQVWHQTPGGSLVAPGNKVAAGVRFEEALDAFVSSGTSCSAFAFARFAPFLSGLPARIADRLVVDLQDMVGWEELQAKVDDDTTRGVQPMWLWSLPIVPFAEGVPLDPEWPALFKGELSLALFGLAGELDEGECVDSSAGVGVEVSSPTTGAKEGSKARNAGAKGGAKARNAGATARMTEAERERWRRHIAAHHIPFRKDCIQCVMSGALGLQHRRVKCPTMYALAFDLAGPFKELGRDDRGGKYKYVLVAGLRVPEAALPPPKPSKDTVEVRTKAPEAQAEVTGTNAQDDDAESEVSWLRDQLEPTPAVMKVGDDGDSSQEEDECSEADWYEAPFVDDVAPSEAEAIVEVDDGPEGDGGAGLDVDPWEDTGGFGEMTDEKFDEALAEMLFSGANQVLRFAVHLKARKGPLILAGLQEVVTECNRLGYPVKIVHTDRAKELMSKATMDWLQSNLIQPSFTQGDDPKSNGLAERLVGWVKARARLHLASSGLGVEQWPSAMAFACAEHRNRLLQTGEKLPRFGQKVIFKSKHPTGKSKRPFLRWEHAVYLCPTPRTEGGHVLLRAASSAYLVAKNVRCVEDMIDPEAAFGNEEVIEADPPEPGFDHSQGCLGSVQDPTLHLQEDEFERRNWNRNPEVVVPGAGGESRLLARVMDFADDGPTEESPFPDRMLMFSVHDVIRDVLEMVILRVEARRPPQEEQPPELMNPILQPPGPPPPEVRAVKLDPGTSDEQKPPLRLPIPLPNPAFIKVVPEQPAPEVNQEVFACKAEATTTKELEVLLSQLHEPLSVTHTASQEEVRANLEKWRPAIEKELGSLKKQGVLISCCGQRAKELIENPETTVISLKGVFTVKAPGGPDDGWFKRKCRLVGCGNQATHVDADSLYAAGAPAEAVRVALTQAYHHKWGAFTTDIKSAFTQTPIPSYAAQRYLLRPPRWLIDLGLAQPGEYYSLGMVLYGFKEAPAWWSDHRDAKLRKAAFAGCHLEQGTADSSVWRIMKGKDLRGYLVTYVDDFLVLSEKDTAEALHQWLLDEAGWETDGLSEASPGHPVRFLGMQLHGYEDGHFSLDQQAYVEELVRAYKLSEANRSKIVCPKEILMHTPETVQPFDEQTVKSAQKVAGECLWLAQRSRIDIAFATTVLCSKVSKDPHGALAIGHRVMAYLHHTKHFKLHLKPAQGVAPLRVYTDASFAPLGQHSYGGHIIEVSGVPVLWKASKQPLISLSSSEAELIQAVEGCMYAESLMTILWDLAIPCTTAELCLDNTGFDSLCLFLSKGPVARGGEEPRVRAVTTHKDSDQGAAPKFLQPVKSRKEASLKVRGQGRSVIFQWNSSSDGSKEVDSCNFFKAYH